MWDTVPCHCSDEVLYFISHNNNDPKNPISVVDNVDGGLNSVYQPPDVVINKPMKEKIRKKYNSLLSRRNDFEPGKYNNR